MFNTGKVFNRDEIPYSHLALKFLESKDFETPEELLSEYVKTISRLENAFDEEFSNKVAEKSNT